jgi:flagellar motility protein MotE (MotC chaperone)
MNKTKVLLLLIVGLVSFALSFGVSMSLRDNAPEEPAADADTRDPLPPAQASVAPVPSARAQELTQLINDVRHKIAVCDQRAKQLDEREQRLEIAEQQLSERASELENLRVKLVAPLTRLKEAQDALERSRLTITDSELANLRKTAAIYEKMDSAAAADVLTEMCKVQSDDPVKILYYMTERSAGKVLAEIDNRELAAFLSRELKRIEQEG